MMGMAGSAKPPFWNHFNSPILARLAYWKAVNEQREAREKMDEQIKLQMQDIDRQRENLRADPNLRMRLVTPSTATPEWLKS